jgi:hypothetical protein
MRIQYIGVETGWRIGYKILRLEDFPLSNSDNASCPRKRPFPDLLAETNPANKY